MLNNTVVRDDVASRVTYTRLGGGTYRLLLDGDDIGSVTFAVSSGGVAHGCGWGVGDEWRGRGIMTRVLPLLLADQAAAGLRVVRTVIADDNEPSWRLASRCGFQKAEPFGSGASAPQTHWWELHLAAPAAAAESALP